MTQHVRHGTLCRGTSGGAERLLSGVVHPQFAHSRASAHCASETQDSIFLCCNSFGMQHLLASCFSVACVHVTATPILAQLAERSKQRVEVFFPLHWIPSQTCLLPSLHSWTVDLRQACALLFLMRIVW